MASLLLDTQVEIGYAEFMENSRLYTVTRAAEVLGCTRIAILGGIHRGELPVSKVEAGNGRVISLIAHADLSVFRDRMIVRMEILRPSKPIYVQKLRAAKL